MRFCFIRGDYKCFTVSVTAFGRQLYFPGQPWSGWTHLSAMWGKITPIYSTMLLPSLWHCAISSFRQAFVIFHSWLLILTISILKVIPDTTSVCAFCVYLNPNMHTFKITIYFSPAVGVWKIMKIFSSFFSSWGFCERNVPCHFTFYVLHSGCNFVHICYLPQTVLSPKHLKS